jgi:hypothetical protein
VGVGCLTMQGLPEVEVGAKPSELDATRYCLLLKWPSNFVF